MANEIKVNQELEDVKSIFNNINAAYDSLESRHMALQRQLEDERWSGKARDKCVDIHGLIIQYAQNIHSIIADYELTYQKFSIGVDEFSDNAPSTLSIKNW